MIDLTHAKVNKRVPKNRFSKAALSDVETITWLYKISSDTAEFRHDDDIEEIQVFAVNFKNGIVNKKDFFIIQKAIPYNILFLSHDRIYYIVEGELFESDKKLLDRDVLLIEQRSARLIDLQESIAEKFIFLKRRALESIPELVIRFKNLKRMEREILQLQRKVDNEKQPNIRLELNDKLKEMRMQQEILING